MEVTLLIFNDLERSVKPLSEFTIFFHENSENPFPPRVQKYVILEPSWANASKFLPDFLRSHIS